MIHINKFIDKIQFFESKNSENFIIPLSDAKKLHTDITKLLLVLQKFNERVEVSVPIVPDKSPNVVSGEDW
jgi:hypothetical protein